MPTATSEHDPAKWPKLDLDLMPTTGIIVTVCRRVDGIGNIIAFND